MWQCRFMCCVLKVTSSSSGRDDSYPRILNAPICQNHQRIHVSFYDTGVFLLFPNSPCHNSPSFIKPLSYNTLLHLAQAHRSCLSWLLLHCKFVCPGSNHKNWAWLGSAPVVETMATTPELAEAMRTALVPAVTAALVLVVVA